MSGFVVAQERTAASELSLGIQSYKDTKYEDAAVHFQAAVALDPSMVKAHLYLATSFAAQVAPGEDTAQNKQLAQQAIEEYQKTLDLHPEKPNVALCLTAIASLYFNTKQYEEARAGYQKAVQAAPDNPELYYSIGVIYWMKAYTETMKLMIRLKLTPADPLVDRPECADLRNSNLAAVRDGIEMMNKAVALRPDYDDAMAYLGLLYRERAQIQCGDRRAYDADVNTANSWVDKTLAAKRKKGQQSQPLQPGNTNDK